MINILEVNETNNMIDQEKLDVRTITLGISLLDCVDSDIKKVNENIYNKITTLAKNLVSTGKDIEREYGIPIVNKRISVTPIALVGGNACKSEEDFISIAKTLDKAAKEVGVNFIGGYSALVSKGMTKAEELLKTTTLSIADVGSAVGYFDQFHFSRAFKKVYGVSPRAWRDEQKGGKKHNMSI